MMTLSLCLLQIHECTIRGLPKDSDISPEFDFDKHLPIEAGLRRHLGLDDRDGRLRVEETRRTRRSIYYRVSHPILQKDVTIRQAL